ncbi:hypothetical protein ACH5RR_034356 [Cinchona calisaya]|uniref:non-specific serine/threonine protein kinase n=1 Tax=Cinchona calisaya TaxID=153742 RepID=A0ABD2YBE6_9GENT
MRKHPSDFISSMLMALSSSLSASTNFDMLLKDIVDPRLSCPSKKEAGKVVLVAKLALSCINPNPQLRLTIQEVSTQLRQHVPVILIGQLLEIEVTKFLNFYMHLS